MLDLAQRHRSKVELPQPRGETSAALLAALREPAGSGLPTRLAKSAQLAEGDDVLCEDLQLALYCCYELAYRGLPGVDERWEWDPGLLSVRGRIEAAFENRLRDECPIEAVAASDVAEALWGITREAGGPSLSGWLLAEGGVWHARELAVHRSAYQLKEADPHSWGIPRLSGEAKAAMITIQADEYGSGVASAMHASLFADSMAALDLDPTYGAYLDFIPGVTLATTNLISMFGLHRRLRGCLVGHLALFEMTSVGPMSRYDAWLERLGIGERGRAFYEVHVVADEVHQHIAADRLVGGLVADEPELGSDVVFGARALSFVEARFASATLGRWTQGRSSLRISL